MASPSSLIALALRELLSTSELDDEPDPYDLQGWAAWRSSTIPLWNHLPEVWETRLHCLIDAFNQELSPQGRLLDHRRQDALLCDAIAPRLLARRGITLCLANRLHNDAAAASIDPLVARDRVLLRAVIRIHQRIVPGEDPLCHELMQALTAILDIPHEQEFPYSDDSCVWGYLNQPGPFDRRFIRWVYAKARQRAQCLA